MTALSPDNYQFSYTLWVCLRYIWWIVDQCTEQQNS